MNKKLRFASGILLMLVLTAGLVFLLAWKSPPYYEVAGAPAKATPYIPFARYDAEHPRPYVVQQPGVVVFGAEHTRDPKHPQMARIEQEWKALRPTVALVEGRLGFLLPGIMDPVKELGEGGKVKALSKKDGIPVYNWDLSKEALAALLVKRFSAEQVVLAQVLNPYFSQLRFGRPEDEAAFLEPFFKRAAYVGLEDEVRTVADIDRLWKKYFPQTDWRTVSDETPLPGFLSEIMTVSNDLRNEQLIAAVQQLRARGERVFLICGSSHAVCVEPALKNHR
ncbi:MAG TPA: hypothetical protein VHK69_02235 [Chitinophagaceae bacterium]|jgi:hypothetical protein|nr:hypothetical protein [Chitinophagaceae bacterium]